LLEADWVLPVAAPPLPSAGVLVSNGAIVGIGPIETLRRHEAASEIRAFPGCALMPGLVNCHTHLDYSILRGFAPPSSFGPWMMRLLMVRRTLLPEDYAHSAAWGAFESAKGGVTTIADTSVEGITVLRAARTAGLRARVYLEVFGLDDSELPTTMERLEARIAAASLETGPLGEIGISPHAPYTVSARLYREVAGYARRSGFRVVTHVAESEAEDEWLRRGTGPIATAYKAMQLWKGQRGSPSRTGPVAYLASTGALGPELLAAHAVGVTKEEIQLLAINDVAVAHCPRSNLFLESAVAPILDMRAAGLRVGLGTDSLASNDSLDLFEEMRCALRVSLLPRPRDAVTQGCGIGPGTEVNPEGLGEETVLEMATLEGARALGLEQTVGSLEPDKRADVIAVRIPQQTSGDRAPRDVIGSLVRHATADDVQMTMVDGNVIYQQGLESESRELARQAFAKARRRLRLDMGE